MSEMMKVKASVAEGITRVRITANHDRESDLRPYESSDEAVSAKFLQEIRVEHGGRTVFTGHLGTAIASEPYIGFRFEGGVQGDELAVHWVDNTGLTGTATAVIR